MKTRLRTDFGDRYYRSIPEKGYGEAQSPFHSST